MKKSLLTLLLASASLLLFPAWSAPDEGMWMMNQLDKLPWPEMKKHGLQLSPAQIYNPDGTSLKDAIVLLGGGTSSFISAEGLILTNHHVAFGAIQSVSSTQDDFLKNGFYAKTRDEELSIPTYQAQIVMSQEDVTSQVLEGLGNATPPAARADSIRARLLRIGQMASRKTGYDCRASEFYNGVKFYLFAYQVLKDVRLVYAPPEAIGNYGGEVDNWYWPRHTGDFSLMRAYAAPDGKPAKYSKENVPFKPKAFLPISAKGYDENSFAMIMGFPGRTYRYRTAAEIQLAKDETLPLTIKFFKKRMDVIEAAGKADRGVAIQYASKWRGLANTFKNYEGTLEGMRRSDVLTERREEERKFLEFLHSKPSLETQYADVLPGIAKSQDELKMFNQKQIGYNNLAGGSDILAIAVRFNTLANHFVKDSSGTSKAPESELQALKEFLPRAFKDINLNVDRELLTGLLLMNAEFPPSQRLQIVAHVAGSRTGEEREKAVREYVKDLYEHSKLTTLEGCMKLTDRTAGEIRDDELVKFAIELDKDNAPLLAQTTAYNARIAVQRAKLLEAWMAWKGPDLYPDANRTLRFTYGQVKPYDPRDAVHYDYVTTLRGVMEKETGEDPFTVPPRLRELWEKKDFGPYADPRSHDIPVAFIADLDITGGNSGSPVINGTGDLIGIAFDGNWEAVVGDYLFQDSLNRTISVDARYILFVLDKFSNAQNIMKELVVH
jgi:hypothetical protein